MTPPRKDRKTGHFITVVRIAGAAPLLLFGLFLFGGGRPLIDLPLADTGRLRWNAGLSMLFFVQHSGMVRRRLQAALAAFLPDHYHRVFYTLASGLVLTVVVLFWQPVDEQLFAFQGFFYWLLRAVFLLGLLGFGWSAHALESFDAFGTDDLKAHREGLRPALQPFTIRGPYRWVRHPFYFFTLLLIWSAPNVTTDRLFFNVLWTTWIYTGAWLEERDLANEFGDAYRRYQSRVPMMIPWRGRR